MSKPAPKPAAAPDGERARVLVYVAAPTKRKLRMQAVMNEISFQQHVRQILEAAVSK